MPETVDAYDPAAYPPFAVTVDLVVLTVRDHGLCVLAVRRGEQPFAQRWALPGGFVKPDESLGDAAVRELAEETGLGLTVLGDGRGGPVIGTGDSGSGNGNGNVGGGGDGSGAAGGEGAGGEGDHGIHLEQLASYGDPNRDPRMRVVSVAYLALAPLTLLASGRGDGKAVPRAGGDAASAAWLPVRDLLGSAELAFDHASILADGVERARSKIEYSSLAAAFCPPEFTVGELRRVYEAVWDVALDPRNFHRKVTGTPGFLVPSGGTTSRQGGRPAQLFSRGTASLLNPPMLRPAVD